MKRRVTFKDRDRNIFNVKVNLEKKEKGLVFSASADCGTSCGQCLGSIKPANEAQKSLVEIWKKYHLNDMHAGTEKQEEALTKCKSNDYDSQVKFLKSQKLYTDKGYKYGTGWLTRELPKNIEEVLRELLDKIEQLEVETKQSKMYSEMDKQEKEEYKNTILKNFTEHSPKYILAFSANQGLTLEETKEIDLDGHDLSYGGVDYLVGDYDDLEQIARDYLTDDPELWKMAVEADRTTKSLDEWADDVINMDGIGSILNGYDGSEDFEEVNGETIYIVRR